MSDIEDLRAWWTRNVGAMGVEFWHEMLELGDLIKNFQESEPVVIYRDRLMPEPVSPEPIEWGAPREPARNTKLDPLPYVQYPGTGHEERFSQNDPARVHGTFMPRPGFDQNPTHYSPFRYRTRGR